MGFIPIIGRNSGRVVVLALVLSTLLLSGRGQGDVPKLPQGYGLSAKYPGDEGLERDPNVVFFENFSIRSIGDLKERWENISHPEIMSLSEDVPYGSLDKRSLLMTYKGEGTGGHLYRRLLPGYDKLFIRFYVKFHPSCAPIHHFFHVGGYSPT